MLLAQIKEDVIKFAEVISKTLDVDVLVVDNNLKTISNTYRYFDKFDLVNHSSVIGHVISSGQVVTLEDKKDFGICRDCVDYKECTMTGFIGVPIFYNDVVVGAVSLVLAKQRVSQIFKDIANAVKFLESMVDLLSSKLRNFDDYNTLRLITRERELLMDSVTDGIVSTDDIGYITYYNKQFAQYFNLEKSCIGKMIQEVIPHEAIINFVKEPSEIKDRVVSIETEATSFNGVLSCNTATVHRNLKVMLFFFKNFTTVRRELRRIGYYDKRITFQWAENRLFSPENIDKAKRFSLLNEVLLISGELGTGKDLMAKCIHMFSKRSDYLMSSVSCDPLARDLQEEAVFGEFGLIHTSHKGTIYFKGIEQLPIYLQKRLVKFLKKPVLTFKNGRAVTVDVKMMFSTTSDLENLVNEGKFNDELFYRISLNNIVMTPLRESTQLLNNALMSCIDFYKLRYGKPDFKFNKDALNMLMKYDWPGNLRQMETVIDQLVYHETDCVTVQDLSGHNLTDADDDIPQPISEIEKEKISQLLKSKVNKGDVAKLLGMSRATLYRKIKKYRLL